MSGNLKKMDVTRRIADKHVVNVTVYTRAYPAPFNRLSFDFVKEEKTKIKTIKPKNIKRLISGTS